MSASASSSRESDPWMNKMTRSPAGNFGGLSAGRSRRGTDCPSAGGPADVAMEYRVCTATGPRSPRTVTARSCCGYAVRGTLTGRSGRSSSPDVAIHRRFPRSVAPRRNHATWYARSNTFVAALRTDAGLTSGRPRAASVARAAASSGPPSCGLRAANEAKPRRPDTSKSARAVAWPGGEMPSRSSWAATIASVRFCAASRERAASPSSRTNRPSRPWVR